MSVEAYFMYRIESKGLRHRTVWSDSTTGVVNWTGPWRWSKVAAKADQSIHSYALVVDRFLKAEREKVAPVEQTG